MYATVIVTERLTPARQCTNTPFLQSRPSSVNIQTNSKIDRSVSQEDITYKRKKNWYLLPIGFHVEMGDQ